MKSLHLLASFFLLALSATAQINMEDSTVQTVGYWDNKEKQEYTVTTEKYRVKNTDTTDRETMKYEVVLTVLDSTAKSYTVEWAYKNFSTTTKDKLMKSLMSIGQDMKVVIR